MNSKARTIINGGEGKEGKREVKEEINTLGIEGFGVGSGEGRRGVVFDVLNIWRAREEVRMSDVWGCSIVD
eukprot:893250-Amorphochlora_amoeboformis.AAC.1